MSNHLLRCKLSMCWGRDPDESSLHIGCNVCVTGARRLSRQRASARNAFSGEYVKGTRVPPVGEIAQPARSVAAVFPAFLATDVMRRRRAHHPVAGDLRGHQRPLAPDAVSGRNLQLSLMTVAFGHGTALTLVATTEIFAGLQNLARAQEEASLDFGATTGRHSGPVTLPNLTLPIIARRCSPVAPRNHL